MKPNEKRLLFALITLLFLGAVLIGFDLYIDKREELLAEQARLETEWIEIEALMEEEETWVIRAAWLLKNQPSFTSTELIDKSIFQESLAAKRSEITTSRQSLLPTKETDHYIQSGVSLTASGKLESVCRWMFDMTKPGNFRVVRNLKLSPDKQNPENVVAQFEFLRWYAPPTQ